MNEVNKPARFDQIRISKIFFPKQTGGDAMKYATSIFPKEPDWITIAKKTRRSSERGFLKDFFNKTNGS